MTNAADPNCQDPSRSEAGIAATTGVSVIEATLQFNPTHFTESQLRTIMLKAQEWECTPAEALGRILGTAAHKKLTKQS